MAMSYKISDTLETDGSLHIGFDIWAGIDHRLINKGPIESRVQQ